MVHGDSKVQTHILLTSKGYDTLPSTRPGVSIKSICKQGGGA